MTDTKTIAHYRAEIQTNVMNDKATFNALATKTFNGLEPANIPQALLEGYMRGFTLKDFMVKDVYATPFWNSKKQKQDYAIVVSISHARKTAQKAGQTGKSEPKFTYTGDENSRKVESCSVTVWKKDGDERGYTATVFFDEYEQVKKTKEGKVIQGMWQTKPRTMLAKVAEMHALRMAFPEAFSELFVEEEFDKSRDVVVDIDAQDMDDDAVDAIADINGAETLEDVQKLFGGFAAKLVRNKKVVEAYNARKAALTPVPEGAVGTAPKAKKK